MSNLEELAEEMGKKPKLEDVLFRVELLDDNSDTNEIKDVVRFVAKLGAVDRDTAFKAMKRRTGHSLETFKKSLEEEGLRNKPDHYGLAKSIIERLGRENLLATAAHLWFWDGKGIWKPMADGIAVWNLVQPILVELGEKVTRGLVESVAAVMKTIVYDPQPEWNLSPDVINFDNGELRYKKGVWHLTTHNRESRLTTQIPHAYDCHAIAPRFLKFLDEIFASDPDAEEKKNFVLEMIGYSMVGHARYEAFLLMIGKGANGKSVLLHVLATVVGKKNVCAVSPSKFSDSAHRAHLHNKLVNIVTEIPEGAKIADAELKSIVSGELITAANKYGHPFEFSPVALNCFAANHMPYTSDHSDGFFRRAFILWFNNTFERGKNANPKLKEMLEEETQGIISLALNAYGEVIQREGKFTEPSSSKAAKKEWQYEVNQVEQFLEDCCIDDNNSQITFTALYFSYKMWADEVGIKKLSLIAFSKRIKALGYKAARTGRARLLCGLRIVEENDGNSEIGFFG